MVASAALTSSNLYTQSFWNFFNLLNNRSNVVDPRDASGNRKLVYSHEPDVNARGFAGYPCVVVNPASIERGDIKLGSDDKSDILGEIVIEVRSSNHFFRDENVNDPHGKGLTYLDQISDDIVQTLNSSANRKTLRANCIGFVDFDIGSVDFIELDQETIYVREITITFKSQLLVVGS